MKWGNQMFLELELKHSLYDIKQEKLDFFKEIATHFIQENTTILKNSTIHKTIDNYAIVLNIWLFLQENREDIYFIHDKMMPYASNFYTFEQIRRNHPLNEHMQSIAYNDDYAFILAYFLSEELIKWVYETLKSHHETVEIMELNRERDYFKLANDEALSQNPTHILYKQQKYVTKTLAANMATKEDFNRAIKKGIKQAKTYWQHSNLSENQHLQLH